MNRYSVLLDPTFPALKTFVLNRTGLAYYSDKEEDLAMRIGRRLDALHLSDCHKYLTILGSPVTGSEEMECLVGELTIGETYFFRQVEHFDLLKHAAVPALLKQNAALRRLRVWSAGCATGEEPYSIAILLEREFRAELSDWHVTILATDINQEFLERARTGRYGEWSFRTTPRDIRAECFTRQGKTWLLKPEYRKRVFFERLNLAEDNPVFHDSEGFDVIFCRNVMIYFSRELIAQTVGRFRDVLRPGGWLAVGHAEFDAEIFARFDRVVSNGSTMYRRLAAEQPTELPLAPVPLPEPERRRTRRSLPQTVLQLQPPAPVRASPNLETVRELADRGAWNAAAALGRQLTAEQPLNAAAHFTLGLILESMLSCREAKEALRRAIYLDRGFVLAHYHLATCQQSDREDERARKSFLNAIDLLDRLPADQRLEHTDGLTVADLKDMAKSHLETLEQRGRTI